MNILYINDLKNGQVQVGWQRAQNMRPYTEPLPFANPLAEQDRKDLRWYLEEYLGFPYGAEEDKAKEIEQRMAKWGESLFEQVFLKTAKDPDPRGYYQEAMRAGLGQCEICISSDDPEFLNIPWELLRDPTAGRGYLAPQLAGLYRQRSGQKIEELVELQPGEPFRVLLVIARPYGERDIKLSTVARPMLNALRPLRPKLELEVLRPPTFDAFQQRLNEQPGHFHLVHFDGHGTFQGRQEGTMSQYGMEEKRGHLVFETDERSEYVVSSEEIGNVLAACRVPLFILNACQSAEEGLTDPFSSVASRLVATGARGVVAMSYSVYGQTAAHYFERFYQSLVRHTTLSKGVADARRALYSDSKRDSVIGPLTLRDWIVPVLYQQEATGIMPIPKVGPVPEEKVKETPLHPLAQAEKVCPEGAYGFVGRDYDLLDIDRELSREETLCVLLSGIGGVGKSELAKGFARWYAETGGCLSVFYAEFKIKADFGQVIQSTIGFGTDFSSLPEKAQWQVLIEFLRQNPCLLVWDNFETVAGYPEGAEALATKEERAKLSQFLKELRGGKSRVLITTRKRDERWLGIGYKLIELEGLAAPDAAALARVILDTVGKRPEDFRNDPDYSRLLQLLRGHPRSLEIVLPLLHDNSPQELIEAIQQRASRLGEQIEDASLAVAFARLSEKTRRHSPFVGLFSGFINVKTLCQFVAHGDEQQRAYESVMGEALTESDWEQVLEEAARAGLVRALGNSQFELHPTLPPFLRRELLVSIGEKGMTALDEEFINFYTAWSAGADKLVERADSYAMAAVEAEEGNLLRALSLATNAERWKEVQAVVQTLGEYYEIRAQATPWRALRNRLLGRIDRAAPPLEERPKGNLWMYLLGNEAYDSLKGTQFRDAENAYRAILDYLESLNDPKAQEHIATAYGQLGLVAHEEQKPSEAMTWYMKSLEIRERLKLEEAAASLYVRMGNVEIPHGDLAKAKQQYEKAREIFERYNNERGLASVYHQLGTVAEARKEYDDAREWYSKAIKLKEHLELFEEAASDYYQVGNLCVRQGLYSQGENWYRKSLRVYETVGNKRRCADVCHQIGVVAVFQEEFNRAEQWLHRALEICSNLKHPPFLVGTLAVMGMLKEKQGIPGEAVAWYSRSFLIATQYEMSEGIGAVIRLALLLKVMGEKDFTAAWKEANGDREPPLESLRQVQKKIDEEDSA